MNNKLYKKILRSEYWMFRVQTNPGEVMSFRDKGERMTIFASSSILYPDALPSANLRV